MIVVTKCRIIFMSNAVVNMRPYLIKPCLNEIVFAANHFHVTHAHRHRQTKIFCSWVKNKTEPPAQRTTIAKLTFWPSPVRQQHCRIYSRIRTARLNYNTLHRMPSTSNAATSLVLPSRRASRGGKNNKRRSVV